MNSNEIKQIIDNVNSSWTKDQIIYYLYIKLAPYFKRDLKYFLASEDKKYEEYHKGFINRGYDIVCSTLCDYYVPLYQSFNINAQKVIATSAKIPLFAIIIEGDNGLYFIDPLNDLFNNQYNLDTTEFGIIPHYKTITNNYPNLISLSKEYLIELRNSLNLMKTNNDYFKELHLNMTNRNYISNYFNLTKNDFSRLFEKKIEFASINLINLGNVNGAYERNQLYLFLERVLFFKGEKKNIKICMRQNNDNKISSIIGYKNPRNNHIIAYREEKDNNQYILKRYR